MDIGIPTLIETISIEEAAKLAHSLGFSFVELNMNLPYCGIEALQNTNLQRLSETYHVYFTIHADENLFFCDFSNRIAQAHLDNMLETIDFSQAHHIPLINFHMSKGVYFTLPERKVYLFEKYRETYVKRILSFRSACDNAAKGSDMMLCIENTGINLPFVLEGVDLLLQSPVFSLTWDIGHDYSANKADSPFLLPRKDRIRHMHFHDAKGTDCHLPPGFGHLPLASIMCSVSPERMVLEVKTIQGIHQSLPWLKEHNLIS